MSSSSAILFQAFFGSSTALAAVDKAILSDREALEDLNTSLAGLVANLGLEAGLSSEQLESIRDILPHLADTLTSSGLNPQLVRDALLDIQSGLGSLPDVPRARAVGRVERASRFASTVAEILPKSEDRPSTLREILGQIEAAGGHFAQLVREGMRSFGRDRLAAARDLAHGEPIGSLVNTLLKIWQYPVRYNLTPAEKAVVLKHLIMALPTIAHQDIVWTTSTIATLMTAIEAEFRILTFDHVEALIGVYGQIVPVVLSQVISSLDGLRDRMRQLRPDLFGGNRM